MAHQGDTPAIDSQAKLKSPVDFQVLKSPTTLGESSVNGVSDFEKGKLRAGGAPSIWSPRHIGVLASFCCVTIVYGMSLSILYAVMNNYLYMSGLLVATAQALVRIPRVLRVFLSVFTDICPIFGYRRRPYLVIGWGIAFIAYFLMAVIPLGPPYYEDSSLEHIDIANMTDAQLALVHPDAPRRGNKFIFLFMLANLGAVIAYGPTHGIFIEMSQQEPEDSRGTLQTNIFLVQNGLGILTAFLTGLGLNSEAYGGDFSWTIGFSGIMWISAAAIGITIPMCWFCVTEEKVTEPMESFGDFTREMFRLVQTQPYYRLFGFRYFTKVFSSISVTASSNIKSMYAGVTPLNNGIASCISNVLVIAGVYTLKRWGLQWDWRYLALAAQLFAVFVDSFPTFFTVWNVYRSQWFWLGVPLLEDFVGEFVDYAGMITMVEIAEPGREATCVGFLASITFSSSPLGTVITKSVDSYFDIGRAALKRDDRAVHMDLTYAYVIAYAFNIFAAAFAFLLPRQKAEAQAFKANGKRSKFLGTLAIIVLIFSICWTVMTNILSLWDSTACLRIAGGSGC